MTRATAVREFLRTEAAGGVALLAATITALIWANTASGSYADVWTDDSRVWINDGLMALFFFVVGLEIKRELTVGELRDPRTAALPAIAAAGGMVVPALVYLAWTAGTDAADGWGIPIATDIAFVVGIMAVLGRRAPAALKLFVLTLAIIDDIGAIVVIALFYGHGLHPEWFAASAVVLLVVLALRLARVTNPLAYVLPGLALWFCVHESGIHATIAGVILALCMPVREVESLEHKLHPVTSFAVIPLFALANAGVVVTGGGLQDALGETLTWAVITGLVVGKFVGVTGATVAAARIGIGRMPAGLTRRHVLGAGALAGIGFTVSLFVADLAFGSGRGPLADAKIGVLLGSIASGVIAVAILWGGPNATDPPDE
ncbi:MAG: Na+/H+ antiporter NhaA [Actinomycetota bacterium]|nr:Na+/H+ antiporter NhaA [Actinomycetota bacterium]